MKDDISLNYETFAFFLWALSYFYRSFFTFLLDVNYIEWNVQIWSIQFDE